MKSAVRLGAWHHAAISRGRKMQGSCCSDQANPPEKRTELFVVEVGKFYWKVLARLMLRSLY